MILTKSSITSVHDASVSEVFGALTAATDMMVTFNLDESRMSLFSSSVHTRQPVGDVFIRTSAAVTNAGRSLPTRHN